jgi:hypothetical protein
MYSQEILRHALAVSIESMSMEIEEALVIEDLDPKHSLRCNVSQEIVEELKCNIVQDWPPSSPDLNPIE